MALPKIQIFPQTFAIAKLSSINDVILSAGVFLSLTRTPEEISVVCELDALPYNAIAVSKAWRCLAVIGPLDFALTGILSPIAKILAEAKISIFAISSYDTDFILVRDDKLSLACQLLRGGGYEILGDM